MDFISFDPRLITGNNLHDDNRPYRYEQKIQEQQNIDTNNRYDEHDNNKEEYMLENQNENRNEDMALNINENNASEYTTPESTNSAQNASQTGTSALRLLVQDKTHMIHNHTQIHLRIVPHRPEEVVQGRTQNITSIRDTSVNVLSPTRTISNSTRNITRPIFDPPPVPSVLNTQIKQFNQKIIIIITNKLLVNTMIHSITLFSHHIIQIFNQTKIKMFLNLTIILI